MDVSGRGALSNLLSSTLRLGSEECSNLYCHTCELSGEAVNANGYCLNCRRHLCANCINSHQNTATSKSHVINRNPVSSSTPVANDKLQHCSTHQNEEVKLYCRAHELLGCVICMTLSHTLCEIDYIPEVSEQFVKSDEYISFETNVNNLKERCAVGLSKIEANIVDIETTYADILSSVENTRKEINDSLDRFENEIEKEVTAYKKLNIDKMESLRKAYDAVVKNVVDTEETMNSLRGDKKYNLLFCECRKAVAKVLEFQSQTYELSTRLSIQECEYQKNTEIKAMLTKENCFGVINIKDNEFGPCNAPETVNRKPMCRININGKGDKKTCYVTGLAFLSSDQLAVADKANKNVKVVDVSFDKMISEITLSSSPRDITVIPPDQLAVTLRDEERIQLLSTTKGLVKTAQIPTVGNCRGIKYDEGKLIVAYDSAVLPKIEILNLDGEVLCKFQFHESGTALVNEPKCIGLCPDHSQMYLTDLSKMCVIRFSRLGNVTGSYGRHRFMGIAVSTGGSVYACSKSGSAVYQMSDDLSKAETVLTADDGIKEPIALVFSKTRNMLYVSCGSRDADVSNKLYAFKINFENAGVV